MFLGDLGYGMFDDKQGDS